jgi:hypothetical protein
MGKYKALPKGIQLVAGENPSPPKFLQDKALYVEIVPIAK